MCVSHMALVTVTELELSRYFTIVLRQMLINNLRIQSIYKMQLKNKLFAVKTTNGNEE